MDTRGRCSVAYFHSFSSTNGGVNKDWALSEEMDFCSVSVDFSSYSLFMVVIFLGRRKYSTILLYIYLPFYLFFISLFNIYYLIRTYYHHLTFHLFLFHLFLFPFILLFILRFFHLLLFLISFPRRLFSSYIFTSASSSLRHYKYINNVITNITIIRPRYTRHCVA